VCGEQQRGILRLHAPPAAAGCIRAQTACSSAASGQAPLRTQHQHVRAVLATHTSTAASTAASSARQNAAASARHADHDGWPRWQLNLSA
jgi:hypothetical protein